MTPKREYAVKSRFYPFLFGLLVGSAALVPLLLIRQCSADSLKLPTVEQPPVKLPADNAALGLEDAFIQVAKAVSPAVVNISSEWTESVPVQGMGGMDDFFDFWFRGPGQQPRQRRPQEYQRKQRSLGSGFVITPDGYLLTNAHVVGKAEKVTVLLENGKDYPGRVVGKDEKTDIALIKIEAGANMAHAPLGNSDAIQVGQWSIAIGNPFGLDHTVTTGVVSAKGRSVNLNENSPYASYIQTDASINPGNSGGPLCNIRGEVIGINTAIYSQSGGSVGIGFAIPSNIARKVAQDLAGGGKVKRAGLGAVVQSLDSKMAKSFGMSDNEGALLSSINKGSAAEKGGLKPGDVVLELDGTKVHNSSDLVAKLYTKTPGDRAKLTVLRQGRQYKLDIVLQALDDAPGPERAGPQKSQGSPSSGELGLAFQDQTPEIHSKLGPDAPKGPVVTQVAPESPAAAAGLRPGDVVLKVDNQDIQTAAELNRVLKGSDMKKGVRLFIWREGVTIYEYLVAGE